LTRSPSAIIYQGSHRLGRIPATARSKDIEGRMAYSQIAQLAEALCGSLGEEKNPRWVPPFTQPNDDSDSTVIERHQEET